MKRLKKILLVSLWGIANDSVGGTERFIVDLASGLSERGYEVDVLMMSGKNHTLKGVNYYSIDFFGEGVDANEYAYQSLFDDGLNQDQLKLFAEKVEKTFDASQYDVVQLNSFLFLYLFTKTRRVFVIHTNPYELALDWGDYALSSVAHMIKTDSPADDIFITPSEHYAKLYSRILEKKVHVIPHSIDVNRLKTDLSKREILDKYGIDNKYIFLVPSRLDFKQKRPQIALKAIATIVDKLPDFEIVFTGLDLQYKEYADTLSKKAANHGISIQTIKFENNAEAYKIANVIILPSRSESFGYSALEAIILGRKVILNNIPTFKEIRKGSTNTFIFDQTADKLASTILKVVNAGPGHRQQKDWQERYSKTKWIDSYENIMERL